MQKSVDFFTQLGFEFNPQFTDENATCMVISDDSFVMLLVESFFTTFTSKDVCDATTHAEVIIALSAPSRDGVDELADKALAAGGQPSNHAIDEGGMYGRSFTGPGRPQLGGDVHGPERPRAAAHCIPG